MTKDTLLPQRKNDHLRINLEYDVDSGITTGFERYRFIHKALPDIDLKLVQTNKFFLGRKLNAPILISSMTGGTEKARVLNQQLAAAAEEHGVAIGVGSQRAVVEDPNAARSFSIVRKFAPNTLVFANLGAVQLNYGYNIDTCREIVDLLQADGLYLHLNPLQEALQIEGQTDFSGLLAKIEAVCTTLEVPVLVKEVGWGLDVETARHLVDAGVQVLDIAGAGGTSWSKVEKIRAQDHMLQEVADAFDTWGIPTASALVKLRDSFPKLPIIASGGIQNGVDAAKSIALGADLAGAARPFLLAASQSENGASRALAIFIQQMRTTMFVSGCASLLDLRSKQVLESY
jgi:isopentenyl-diphosphate Delta-isomerase